MKTNLGYTSPNLAKKRKVFERIKSEESFEEHSPSVAVSVSGQICLKHLGNVFMIFKCIHGQLVSELSGRGQSPPDRTAGVRKKVDDTSFFFFLFSYAKHDVAS